MGPWGFRFFLGLILAVYFLYFTGDALHSGFTHDDLMNLHRGWIADWPSLAADNLLFFRPSDSYRPLGSVFYRLIYDRFGFDPLPLRACLHALLLLNLLLLWRLGELLSGSTLAGWSAAMLAAFHPFQIWLHFNSGFVYDILAFTFASASVVYYVGIRRTGIPLSAGQMALWAVLYVLALDAKEIAAPVPAILLVWELLRQRPRSVRVPMIGLALAALFVAGRVVGPQSISIHSGYTIEPSPALMADRIAYIFNLIFLDSPRRGRIGAAVLVVAAAVYWWRGRSTVPIFGLLFFAIAILPLAVIPQRGLDQAYWPAAGLALSAGFLAAEFASYLIRPRAGAAIAVAAVLVALWARHLPDAPRLLAEGRMIGGVAERLKAEYPGLPPGAKVYFADDPFDEPFGYSSWFMIRLLYNDREIVVDRPGRVINAPHDVTVRIQVNSRGN